MERNHPIDPCICISLTFSLYVSFSHTKSLLCFSQLCTGLEGEGWIDPWSLLRAFKQKNISLGTKYVHGELIDFEFLTKQDHGAGDRNLRLDSGVVSAKWTTHED